MKKKTSWIDLVDLFEMLKELAQLNENLIREIGYQFHLDGTICSTEVHGNGNVNDTFLLFCESNNLTNRYTLQRINHEVFKNPEGLMENFLRVTQHLQAKLLTEKSDKQALCLVQAKDGRPFFQDNGGNYWRVTKFIDGGRSFEVPENLTQAYEAAKAFGDFQAKLADLPGEPLIETIADFHNTRLRYEHFLAVLKKDEFDRVKEVQDLVEFAMENESLADAIQGKNFPLRVVHNDTKLNNILLHKTSGQGMCVVDLDTVMSGCVLHDFGDLVRTAACSALEDEPDLDKIFFLPKIFEAIIKGYHCSTGEMLESSEIENLALAPKVITYELGLRFLADYLEGDVYFKVKRPGHNIDRVRAQFKLLSSMKENFSEMQVIVRKLYSSIIPV